MPRDRVFISYSHKDRTWFDRVAAFLKAIESEVNVWSDHDIPTGARWRDEIDEAVASTRVALLLVTQNFLASDFIKQDELTPFLEAEEAGDVEIFWVAVGHSTYTLSPLKDLQSFNDPGQPLESLTEPEQNEVLVRLATEMMDFVERG